MNVSDMMSEISDAGYGDVTAVRQVSYINDTLWDITHRERWPFREKNIALLFDGSSDVPTNWPTDFSQAIWIYDTSSGVSVWPERVETIRDLYANTLSASSAGNPISSYYFIGKRAHFYPVPVSDGGTSRYSMDYVADQTELTSGSVEADILLPKQFHRAIVAGVLYKLAMLYDDTDIAPMYQAEFENKLAQMREELLRRQYQRADQIYVTDEEDEFTNRY